MKLRHWSAFALVLAVGTLARAAEAGPDVPPVAIKQVEPEYPWTLRLHANKGKVVVDFIVDPQGNVVRALVAASSHPDFEAPAVEAVLQWKFRPGLKAGRPVYVHMQVPVYFAMRPGVYDTELGLDTTNGREVWSVPSHAPKGTPAEFAYDAPPKPLVTAAPVYPLDLLAGDVRGKATVDFAVDPHGRTHLVRVASATGPEFAAAASAMILAWTFEPAQKAGQPCWALLSKDVDFRRADPEFPLSDSALRLLKDLKRTPCPILTSGRALDAPIRGRFQPSPVVPDALLRDHASAQAVVEFIVDHAGHAQLPRIVSATDPAFGWAAATAVARWQFTPPLSQGHPVDVRVTIPLVYSDPAPAPAKGT
jgi:TonB family protein